MNERIKELRKSLGLTQQDFANRIGVKRNTIAQYEIGRNEPIDSVFSLMCKEFNVNEDWLRNGVGSMFLESETFSLDEYAAKKNLSQIDITVIRNFMDLDPSTRNAVYDLFKNVPANEHKKSIYDGVPSTAAELEKQFPPVGGSDLDTKIG